MKANVQELKVGDEVGVCSRVCSRLSSTYLHKVARLTNTFVVLDDGSRWSRLHGRKAGHKDSWNWPELVTPEYAREQIALQNRRSTMRQCADRMLVLANQGRLMTAEQLSDLSRILAALKSIDAEAKP